MNTQARVQEAATELAREHDEIDRLATLVSTLPASARRRAVLLEICRRYAAHAQAEARFLMPVVRLYLPDGARAVAEETGRHRAVIRTITTYLRLCQQDPDSRPQPGRGADGSDATERFDRADELDIVVGQLVAGIQSHVEQQDTVLLGQLNRLCPLTESTWLAERLHDAFAAARAATVESTAPDAATAGNAAVEDTPPLHRARPARLATPAQRAPQSNPARPHRIRTLFRHLGRAFSLHPRQPARTG